MANFDGQWPASTDSDGQWSASTDSDRSSGQWSVSTDIDGQWPASKDSGQLRRTLTDSGQLRRTVARAADSGQFRDGPFGFKITRLWTVICIVTAVLLFALFSLDYSREFGNGGVKHTDLHVPIFPSHCVSSPSSCVKGARTRHAPGNKSNNHTKPTKTNQQTKQKQQQKEQEAKVNKQQQNGQYV